jgi:predicted DNA-binding transcriptional regulator YafY
MKEKTTVLRIAYLLNELHEKGHFTRSGLIEHMRETTKEEPSDSTIKRTINDMREYFSLDIAYSTEHKYYYVREKKIGGMSEEDFIDRFEKVRRAPSKSQELLIFYSFVKSMIFSEYYFPPREIKDESGKVRDYEDILRIIEAVLKDELDEKDIKLAEKIEYHHAEHYKASQRTKFNNMINEILDSMRNEYLIRFRYNDNEVTVEPVKIIHYGGIWYLMGYVVSSQREDNLNKVRTYNIALIQSNIFNAKRRFTGDDFVIPEFKDSFGIISSRNLKTAKIRFYGKKLVARMKELLWVDSQKTSLGNDPVKGRYCEYELPYPARTNFEIIGKVLSFMGDAEIISPPELRKEWEDTIRKMFKSIK